MDFKNSERFFTDLSSNCCPGSERFLSSKGESPRPSGQDPNLWTVEDVMQFIRDIDPQLGPHADLFRKHVSEKYRVPAGP